MTKINTSIMETANIVLTTEHRGGQKSTSFAGRPEGENVREILSMDDKDQDNNKYHIIVPSGTTAFNPSFFLGFLFKSIKRLGLEKFNSKYEFNYDQLNDILREIIKNDISEGMRNAYNEMQQTTGLD